MPDCRSVYMLIEVITCQGSRQTMEFIEKTAHVIESEIRPDRRRGNYLNAVAGRYYQPFANRVIIDQRFEWPSDPGRLKAVGLGLWIFEVWRQSMRLFRVMARGLL